MAEDSVKKVKAVSKEVKGLGRNINEVIRLLDPKVLRDYESELNRVRKAMHSIKGEPKDVQKRAGALYKESVELERQGELLSKLTKQRIEYNKAVEDAWKGNKYLEARVNATHNGVLDKREYRSFMREIDKQAEIRKMQQELANEKIIAADSLINDSRRTAAEEKIRKLEQAIADLHRQTAEGTDETRKRSKQDAAWSAELASQREDRDYNTKMKLANGDFKGYMRDNFSVRGNINKQITSNNDQISLLDKKIDRAREAGDMNAVNSLTSQKGGLKSQNLKLSATATAISVGIEAVKKTVQGIQAAFKKMLNISLSIKDNFNDAVENVSQMLNTTTGIASYDISSSLTTNASARNLQMQYGISSGQTWALSQVGNMLGVDVTNMEDFAYMNESQRSAFSTYMAKYNDWYEKLSSSGALESIQKMQLEFSMFKQEVSMEILQWVAENKDVIMDIAKASLTVLKALLNVVKGIMSLIPSSSNIYKHSVADEIGGYGSDTLSLGVS